MTADARSIDANKDIVRRFPTEVFDDGETDLVDEYFASDFVSHVPPTPGELHGPDGFKALVEAFRTGFPDLHHPEIHLVGEGDVVVARLTGTGTHEGEFLGVEPTGESIRVTAMEMYRVADGRIVEAWINLDTLGLLRQLGAVPEV